MFIIKSGDLEMNDKDIIMKDIYLGYYSLMVRLHVCVLSVMYYVD